MANTNAEVNALLGRGSEFEGKLTFEGTVRIDGKFAGEVFSDDTLIIGEGARVKAEITVSNAIIYGDVIGNIKAKNSIELHAPARLKGNIVTPSLMIDQGVVFDGNCQMQVSDKVGKPTERTQRTTTPPGDKGTAPAGGKTKIEPAIV